MKSAWTAGHCFIFVKLATRQMFRWCPFGVQLRELCQDRVQCGGSCTYAYPPPRRASCPVSCLPPRRTYLHYGSKNDLARLGVSTSTSYRPENQTCKVSEGWRVDFVPNMKYKISNMSERSIRASPFQSPQYSIIPVSQSLS